MYLARDLLLLLLFHSVILCSQRHLAQGKTFPMEETTCGLFARYFPTSCCPGNRKCLDVCTHSFSFSIPLLCGGVVRHHFGHRSPCELVSGSGWASGCASCKERQKDLK